MKIYCPDCHHQILASDISLEKDLVKCVNCNSVWEMSKIMENAANISVAITEVEPYPPAYGKIRLEEKDLNAQKITLPPKGFGLETLGIGGFALFWLSFIAFWTWGASQGSLFFAAFSIPFWLVGFGMAGFALNSLIGSQSIILKNGSVEVRKDYFPFPKKFTFSAQEVKSIQFKKEDYKGFAFQNNRNKHQPEQKDSLVIKTNRQKIVCFEGIAQEEGEWLRQYLLQMLNVTNNER